MAAAASQTVEKYCALLIRSRLMSQDDVKVAFGRWQETTRGNADDAAEPFRRFLVARNQLTEYQSHLLMRGHTEGYFIDQYKILELIGKGRMAGVYKAVHSSGQVVAVKVLPPSKAKDPSILSRFQREGNMLTRLDHSNVVRAFHIGETNGRHFIVMEHLDGEPLDETLERRKRLPVPEAVRIIHQALLGLQHVFEKGMVHRDLRPINLMLAPPPLLGGSGETTFASTVKILDIGLGRSTFDESTNQSDPDTFLTQDGTILGSAEYLAPEQARNAHEADIRADIYSLGCVLHRLLTGHLPFPPTPGEGVLQQVVRHVTETPKPIADYVRAPEGLQKVLDWMMAKDPNQRYPTPARAAQALQTFLAQTPQVNPAAGYVDSAGAAGFATPAPIVEALPATARGRAAATPEPFESHQGIPVGRLEPDPRRKDRSGERRRDVAAPYAQAPMAAAPIVETDQYDVEVISPPLPGPTRRGVGEPRGLLELDRRDWIMAAFGAGIVLIAILIGFGLSRLMRGTPPSDSTAAEQQGIQTPPQNNPPLPKNPPGSKELKVDDKKNMEQPDDKKPKDKKPDEKKADDKKTEEKPKEKQ